MTVQSTIARADYHGNNVTTLFTVPFYFLDNSHIKVVRTDNSTSPPTTATLALGTDYVLTGAGAQGGGSLQTTVAPSATQVITILRNVPFTQLIHYVPNDPFPAATHEQALDQLTMEVQELNEVTTHALQFPTYEPVPATLPAAATRASTVLGFDANGQQTLLPIPASVGAGDLRDETFTAGIDFTPGTTQTLTLSRAYAQLANLSIHFDGTFQGPENVTSLVGNVLTFAAPIPVGVSKVYIKGGTTISVGLQLGATYATAESFGAKGDGANNDAPAINAALAAFGVVALLPGKTYRITQPIYVPFGRVLKGPGEGLFTGVRYKTFGVNGFFHPQGVAAIAVDFGGGNTNEANSAVLLAAQATVKGISFYYPSQSAATLTPTPYPATIALWPGTESNVSAQTVTTPSVVSCHFCNPYRAISFSQIHNSGFVSQCTGYAYDNFAFFDQSNDTNRMNDCQINAVYSYYGDFPANSMLSYQYASTTADAIRCGRADAMEFNNNYVFGFYKGLSLTVFTTGSPNGIFINGGGFEGCFFPVVMATLFRRITLRGVQFGVNPIGMAGGGPSVSIGVPSNTGVTSEVRLIGCTSFTSMQQAVNVGNVNGVDLIDCHWQNSNVTNQGFVTGVLNFIGCNNVKVIGNHMEQNSGNPNGQFAGVANCNGVIFADNSYTGQTLSAPNIAVSGCNAARFTNNIEQRVSPTNFGTGIVFSTSSQTYSDGYIQY